MDIEEFEEELDKAEKVLSIIQNDTVRKEDHLENIALANAGIAMLNGRILLKILKKLG